MAIQRVEFCSSKEENIDHGTQSQTINPEVLSYVPVKKKQIIKAPNPKPLIKPEGGVGFCSSREENTDQDTQWQSKTIKPKVLSSVLAK